MLNKKNNKRLLLDQKNKLRELIRKKKFIIFDFDGTLVNSIEAKTSAFLYIYKDTSLKNLRLIKLYHEKHGGVSRYEKIKYFHKNYLKKELTINEFNFLLKKFSEYIVKKVIRCDEVQGAEKFIRELKEVGKINIINSGTPKDEMIEILKAKKWNNYFDYTFGSPKTKINNLSKLLKKEKSSKFIFFGDSYEDMKTADYYQIDYIHVVNEHNIKFADYPSKIIKINNFHNII